MFGIAGTVELGTICPGTGIWNRLQDGRGGALLQASVALGSRATQDANGYTS